MVKLMRRTRMGWTHVNIPTALPRQAPIAIVGKKIPAGICSIQSSGPEYGASPHHYTKCPGCQNKFDACSENEQKHVLSHGGRA